uniref:Uncharacterized protein n=1 Tax=Salix viminalis TaxID=40686 RepID=A0A6N2MXQ8_SALVM
MPQLRYQRIDRIQKPGKRRKIPGSTILQANTNKTLTVRSGNRNQEQIKEEEEVEEE